MIIISVQRQLCHHEVDLVHGEVVQPAPQPPRSCPPVEGLVAVDQRHGQRHLVGAVDLGEETPPTGGYDRERVGEAVAVIEVVVAHPDQRFEKFARQFRVCIVQQGNTVERPPVSSPATGKFVTKVSQKRRRHQVVDAPLSLSAGAGMSPAVQIHQYADRIILEPAVTVAIPVLVTAEGKPGKPPGDAVDQQREGSAHHAARDLGLNRSEGKCRAGRILQNVHRLVEATVCLQRGGDLLAGHGRIVARQVESHHELTDNEPRKAEYPVPAAPI